MSGFRPPIGTRPRGWLRILIVDDEPIISRLLQAMLAPHGNCICATDGEQALDKWEESWRSGRPFHLVCLDINMPKRNGHEVLAAIRASEAARKLSPGLATRIIMTTSRDDSVSVMTAFRHQCEAYLIKPIDPDRLEDHLLRLGLVRTFTSAPRER